MEPPTITPATTVGYSSYVEPNSTIPRLSRVGDSHIPGISDNPKTAGSRAGEQSAVATTRQPKEDLERGASAVRVRTDPKTSGGSRETAADIKPAVDRRLHGYGTTGGHTDGNGIQIRPTIRRRPTEANAGATGGHTDANGIQIRPTIGRRPPKANPVTKRSNSNTVGGVEIREEEIMIGVRYHTKRV